MSTPDLAFAGSIIPHAVYLAWTWRSSGCDQSVNGRGPVVVNAVGSEAGRTRYLITELSMEESAQVLRARP